MKRLVTHEFPHLDDIAAIWLWKKYVPGFAKAKVEFVRLKGGGEAVTYKNKPVDSDANVVHFGVGRGKYDEHKGDIGKCATLLVFEDLMKKKRIPSTERVAVEKLVEFVNLQDTGMLGETIKHREMYVPWILRYIEASNERQAIGEKLLGASFLMFLNSAVIERDWNKRTEFSCGFGKVIALETPANGPDWKAYDSGAALLIHFDPVRKWLMLRGNPKKGIDLTPVYYELRKVDPKASWYLHQSKGMLMNGSRSAPNVVMSKLSLKKMIEIVKHVAPGTNKGKA